MRMMRKRRSQGVGEVEAALCGQPWVILGQPLRHCSHPAPPQRCHTGERDMSPSVTDVLQLLSVGSGPQAGRWSRARLSASTWECPHSPGSSFHVCCHQQTCGAKALLCLGPAPAAQEGLSPFAGGAPGAVKGGPVAAPSLWAGLEGWTPPCGARSSVPLSCHHPWPFLGS